MRGRPDLSACLLAMCSAVAVAGQVPSDSLWRVWSNTRAADTSRLAALHKLTKEGVLFSDPDSAYALAGLQMAFAARIGNAYYEGEALNTQGISLAMRGKKDEAFVHFRRSLGVLTPDSLTESMASTLYNIGNLYLTTGNADSGMVYLRRSLDLCERRGHLKVATRCYQGFGRNADDRGEPDAALAWYEKSLEASRKLKDTRGEISTMINMATVHKNRGDHARAMDLLAEALRTAERTDDRFNIGFCLDNIGNLYARQGEHAQALAYYRRALAHATARDDRKGITNALINLGNAYSGLHAHDSTIIVLRRALGIARDTKDRKNEALILTDLGMALNAQHQVDSALYYSRLGLELKRELGSAKGIPASLADIGTILTDAGRYREARPYSAEALELANDLGLTDVVEGAAWDLFRIHKGLGDPRRALEMYELHTRMRDSLVREENQRALLRHEYRYTYEKQALADSLEFARQQAVKDLELQKQEAELRRQRNVRYSLMLGLALVLSFAGIFLFQRNRIAREKERSEELLLNILPAEVAEELKMKGEADAKQLDRVTVLFTDFKGFTAMSEMLTPKELVRDIHECFSAFDRICGKHGIEKIKTIGDAYMAAGGLPVPNTTHARDVIKAALEMRDFIAEGKARKVAAGLPYFEIRIGVHTGPVVAGIVGVKKFQYDIWGDTVNTASRMESSGEVGQVNISEATYALVRDETGFSFTPRGKVQAKGKGEMEMYFVRRSGEDA